MRKKKKKVGTRAARPGPDSPPQPKRRRQTAADIVNRFADRLSAIERQLDSLPDICTDVASLACKLDGLTEQVSDLAASVATVKESPPAKDEYDDSMPRALASEPTTSSPEAVAAV